MTHRKRVKHFEGTGEPRFLTFSCFQRRPFLQSDRARGWYLAGLKKAVAKHDVALWAWVLMPEHVHLVIWPRELSFEASDFLWSFKQSVANRAGNFLRKEKPDYWNSRTEPFHFWQDGPGFDENLEDERAVWDIIDYVHLNPVRRKLCARIEEWEWSSAREHLGLPVKLPLIDRTSLPNDPRR